MIGSLHSNKVSILCQEMSASILTEGVLICFLEYLDNFNIILNQTFFSFTMSISNKLYYFLEGKEMAQLLKFLPWK